MVTSDSVKHHGTPRSYVVKCQGRKYRRNREHLRLSTYDAHENSRLALHKETPSDKGCAPKVPVEASTERGRSIPEIVSPRREIPQERTQGTQEKEDSDTPGRITETPTKENVCKEKRVSKAKPERANLPNVKSPIREMQQSPKKSRSGRVLKSTKNPDFK